MSRRTLVLFSMVSVSALAALVAACSGDDTNNADGGDATTNDVATTETGGGDTGTDAADSGGDVVTNPCIGSDAGCRACCVNQNPDAAAVFLSSVESCACTTPGDCKANNVCGNNFCKGMDAGSACVTCLLDPDAGGCFQKGAQDCLADPGCAAVAACAASCGDGG